MTILGKAEIFGRKFLSFTIDWNSANIKPASSGDYRVYARFEPTNPSGQIKEASYEFKVQ